MYPKPLKIASASPKYDLARQKRFTYNISLYLMKLR